MSPRELYAERLRQRQREIDALRARERTFSIARLATIAAAIALAFADWRWALPEVVAFILLVVAHDRVIRKRQHAERSAAFFLRGLARVDGTWAGGGDAGEEFVEEHHPYAGDFDLFGRGSLFELISLAVTHAGRARLAGWLKEPSRDAREIAARQAAVLELRDDVALREELAVGAAEVVRDLEAAKLDAWASLPVARFSRAERVGALALPALAVILLLLALPGMIVRVVGMSYPDAMRTYGAIVDFPLWPFLLAAIGVAFLSRHLSPRIAPITIAVERAEPALALLGAILGRIERETFQSPRLVALAQRIRGDVVASEAIDRLRKRVALLDARRNQFFAPIALLLMWTPNVAFSIERWRAQHGARILDWIDAVGELEALSSLASFAFEHPSFAMPEIVEHGPLFDARDLGHPLIPGERRITNDIHLGDAPRLLVVSGSNMSGKSTMMRSTGIAAVLALAGAPVCAASLRVSPMSVGASIRIHDSLQENASRFYAEILRIRQVLDLARGGPLLFLLDEVLAGTNSHDRRIGAEAIVRALVAQGAIGLVSTHDLALAQIAGELAPAAANVHFEDHIEEGKVVFDYRMRPGVVTKSNALELMRSVGIEV